MIESISHITFKVSELDIDEYIRKIRDAELEIIEGRNRIEGEARSVYCYDYDNNLFELHTGTLSERLSSYRKMHCANQLLLRARFPRCRSATLESAIERI